MTSISFFFNIKQYVTYSFRKTTQHTQAWHRECQQSQLPADNGFKISERVVVMTCSSSIVSGGEFWIGKVVCGGESC